MIDNPAKTGYIGNSNAVADKQAVWRFGQVGVHGAIETIGLIGVAVDAVLNLFGCESCGIYLTYGPLRGYISQELTSKVLQLSLHRAQATDLPGELKGMSVVWSPRQMISSGSSTNLPSSLPPNIHGSLWDMRLCCPCRSGQRDTP